MAEFASFHPISRVSSFHPTPLIPAPIGLLSQSSPGFNWNNPTIHDVGVPSRPGVPGHPTNFIQQENGSQETEANGMNTNSILARFQPGQTEQDVRIWRWEGDLLFANLSIARDLKHQGNSHATENEHNLFSLQHLNRTMSSPPYKRKYDSVTSGSELAGIFKFIGVHAPGELPISDPMTLTYNPHRMAHTISIWPHAREGHHLYVIWAKVLHRDLENDYLKNETKIYYGPDYERLTKEKTKYLITPDPKTANPLRYTHDSFKADNLDIMKKFALTGKVEDAKTLPIHPPPPVGGPSGPVPPLADPADGDPYTWQLVPWSSPDELPPHPSLMSGNSWYGHAVHIGRLQHFQHTPPDIRSQAVYVDGMVFPRDTEYRENSKRLPFIQIMVNTH